MKAFILIVAALVSSIRVHADDSKCLMIPNVQVKTCCKQIEMVDKSVIEESYRELSGLNHSEIMMQCKLHESLFKKLNLVKDHGLDKDASFKYVDKIVADTEWNKVLKNSIDFCLPKMTEKSVEFQKQVGIPIETCNVLFSGIIICLDMATFIYCPAKSVLDAPGCTQAKEFTSKCVDDDEAMGKFVRMQ